MWPILDCSLKACAARFPAKVATVRPFPPATSRKACRSRAEREILRAQSKKSISKASSSGDGSSFEGWLAANDSMYITFAGKPSVLAESVLATNVDTLCLILPREGKRIRVVCELSPTLTSDFSTRVTMCRSQKLIFKKAGTLIVLMCTNNIFHSSIQDQIGPVQRTKWSLCSDHHGSTPKQSPTWQRRLCDLPWTFPPSGPFQKLLRCANDMETYPGRLCKSREDVLYRNFSFHKILSHRVRIVLHCVIAVYLQCTIKDDSKPRHKNGGNATIPLFHCGSFVFSSPADRFWTFFSLHCRSCCMLQILLSGKAAAHLPEEPPPAGRWIPSNWKSTNSGLNNICNWITSAPP